MKYLIGGLKIASLALALALVGAVQFHMGFTHGWNSAPAPTIETVMVPVEVEVPRVWDTVVVLGIKEDGTIVRDPSSDEGLVYVVTLSYMEIGGYSEQMLPLPFGDGYVMLTLRCASTDFAVNVRAIEGANPKLPEPEDDGPAPGEADEH